MRLLWHAIGTCHFIIGAVLWVSGCTELVHNFLFFVQQGFNPGSFLLAVLYIMPACHLIMDIWWEFYVKINPYNHENLLKPEKHSIFDPKSWLGAEHTPTRHWCYFNYMHTAQIHVSPFHKYMQNSTVAKITFVYRGKKKMWLVVWSLW